MKNNIIALIVLCLINTGLCITVFNIEAVYEYSSLFISVGFITGIISFGLTQLNNKNGKIPKVNSPNYSNWGNE